MPARNAPAAGAWIASVVSHQDLASVNETSIEPRVSGGSRVSVHDEHIDVSVLVPTFNEKRFIADCAERMRAQRFDGTVELLFIDGRSDDGTREFLDELARQDACVRVLDNPARPTPNALNVGLAAARGEFVARMDAHTFYPPEYLAAGVRRLRQGGVEWLSGPALPLGVGRWSRLVALGMESALGVGGRRSAGTRADGRDAAALPLVWAIMHLAWGGGFLAGCACMGVPVAAVRSCLRPRRRSG